jgi:heme-degrading monooxygenase HmoA
MSRIVTGGVFIDALCFQQMSSINALSVSVLLSLVAAGGNLGCRATEAKTTEEAKMREPLTIDLRAHPNLQFRIDAFTVPAASRSEFEAVMHRNLAFLEKLPGFMHHMVFEKTNGPTTFDIVTIAVWESPEAIAAAGEKVRAYYQSIGFDLPAMVARLGITASLGYYRAPLPLQ